MANETTPTVPNETGLQSIVLGGGCFWCTEAAYQNMRGITDVESGYANGEVDNPSYEQVCAGDTGHNEVVKLEFDRGVTSLRQILEVFFVIHDPTTPNRQGNDVGEQYRSGIYWHDEAQKQVADDIIREMGEAKVYSRPIVTEVEKLPSYFPAEAYHQDYFDQHPNQGYCAMVAAPKVEKFKHAFKQLVKA